MTSAHPGPAIRINYRFALASGEQIFEVATLRRPEFLLRLTDARSITVDERLLSGSFPIAFARRRSVALMVLTGTIDTEDIGRLGPGDAALVDETALGRSRQRNAAYVYLEWAPGPPGEALLPRRLERPALERVDGIARALLSRTAEQRATLDDVFNTLRAIGAPCALSVEGLEGEPTDHDRSFASALEAQYENFASRSSTAVSLGESMRLSERQVHRLFAGFAERFGVSARSWRDARNRWRIENAAILLGRPELTVTDVAREVGYASPNALARAFAEAGFPAPGVVRERMSERDPLSSDGLVPGWRP